MPDPSGAGIHLAASRTRLGQINDPVRNQKLVAALEELIESCGGKDVVNVLCLSEPSLLPVIFAAVYEKKGASGKARIHVCSKDTSAAAHMHTILEQYFVSCGFRNSTLVKVDGDISELTVEHLPTKVT